jgi:hypothetical protein
MGLAAVAMDLPLIYNVLAFALVARFFFHLAVFILEFLHAHVLRRYFISNENFREKYGEWAGKQNCIHDICILQISCKNIFVMGAND